MPTLWTPDRDIDISTQRDVVPIPAPWMKQFEALHPIAQKLDLMLMCVRCLKPFMGYNGTTGQTQAIACGCRELRATVRSSALVTT